MDLQSIKAHLASQVASQKSAMSSGTYLDQRRELSKILGTHHEEVRGLLSAGSAPTYEESIHNSNLTDTPNDSLLTRAAKEIYNTVTPQNMNVGINYGGMKHYNTDNKDFNDYSTETIKKTIDATPDDPNGAGTFYYVKVKQGYKPDGSPNWVYKPGTSEDSVFMRELNSMNPDDYQVLMSKRTNAYQDLEKMTHGSMSNIRQRTYDTSHAHNGILNTGNTELYNTDILGMDNQSTRQLNANRLADEQKAIHNRGMSHNNGFSNVVGSSLASGAINLVGKATKAVGELESTNTDNNFLTRAGQSLENDADKIANYNRHDQNLGGYQMQAGATKLAKGDLTGLLDMTNGIITGGPEAFLNSAPEMIAQTAGGFTPVGLAAKAGVLLANTNDQLDNRLQNTGVRKNATWDEKAGVLASQAIVQAMDTAAFTFVTHGAKVAIVGEKTGQAIPIAEFLKGKSPTFIGAFAKGLSTAAKGTEGVAVEGMQEAAQEAINILQEQYGTEKYKDQSMGSILGSNQNIARMQNAAAQGAIAGGSMSMSGSSIAGAKDTYKGVASAIEDRNMRSSAKPGSQGEADLNSASLDTVVHDATQSYNDLGDIHNNVTEILKSDKSNVDKISALDESTKNTPTLNNKVQEVTSAIVNNTMQSLSPEINTQLRDIMRSNPNLDEQVSNAEHAISQQIDPANPISPDDISYQAVNSVISNMPFADVIKLLQQVAPESVNKYLNAFNPKAALEVLSDEIISQQHAYGTQANEAVRQSQYQQDNAPTIDNINDGIKNLSQRSSKWSKKAISNVSDVLSKLNDSALTEAVTHTGELAKATKQTRSLWQTLKGEEKQGGVLDPKQILGLIKQEQDKRTKSNMELLKFLHDKSWSKNATKDMISIAKQVDAISKSVGMDTVSPKTGNTMIHSDPAVKKLFHSISNFISNMKTEKDREYAQGLIKSIELNAHLMNERLINALQNKLDKATINPDNKTVSKSETVKDTGEVFTKSENTVQKLIDSGKLNTKHALAGVLRSNQFGNRQQIGIVRKAIESAEKSGEINAGLAKSMNSRLDLLTQVFEDSQVKPVEVTKDISESMKPSDTINTTLALLQEYDPTITTAEVASILKEAPQERLDKIVKMICG